MVDGTMDAAFQGYNESLFDFFNRKDFLVQLLIFAIILFSFTWDFIQKIVKCDMVS
nr:hypothetical protein [Candidatus Sigynarchaeota archaeon]